MYKGNSGVIRCISDFHQPFISKTADLRAKHTPKYLLSGFMVIVCHLVKQNVKASRLLVGPYGTKNVKTLLLPQIALELFQTFPEFSSQWSSQKFSFGCLKFCEFKLFKILKLKILRIFHFIFP